MAILPRTNGAHLTDGQKQKLKDALRGQVLIKGQTPDEEYQPFVQRWNLAYTSQAVRLSTSS